MAREQVSIRTKDGECPTSVFTPSSGAGPWPGVIAIMDAFGIRPTLHNMAQRIADFGYIVLVPDMYYRQGPYAEINPIEAFAGDIRAIIGPLMGAIDTSALAKMRARSSPISTRART